MNMTLMRKTKKNYSVHFGCIHIIHHLHNIYKSLQAYVKHSYKQNPPLIFFQNIIDSMKKLEVLARVDFGNFGIGKAQGFRD